MSLLIVQPIPSPVASSNRIGLASSLAIRGNAALIPSLDSELRFSESASPRPRGILTSQGRMVVSSQTSIRAIASVAGMTATIFGKSALAHAIALAAASNRMTWTTATAPVKASGRISAASNSALHSLSLLMAKSAIGGTSAIAFPAFSHGQSYGSLNSAAGSITFLSSLSVVGVAGISAADSVTFAESSAVLATAGISAIESLEFPSPATMRAIAPVSGHGAVAFAGHALNDRGFGVQCQSVIGFHGELSVSATASIAARSIADFASSETCAGLASASSTGIFVFSHGAMATGKGSISSNCKIGLDVSGSMLAVGSIASISSVELPSSSAISIAGFILGTSSMSFTSISDPDGLLGLGPHMTSHSPNFVCKLRNSHRLRSAGMVR